MKTSLCSALAVASLCFASTAFSADQPVGQATTLDVKQLPAAVQATLDREGGRVEQVREKMENGSKSYEVTVSKNGKNSLFTIDNNGSIVKANREVGP